MIKGIGASAGYAIGKVLKLKQIDIDVTKKMVEDSDKEIARLDNAIEKSLEELGSIKDRTAKQIDEESAAIFEAHMDILHDPEFIGAAKQKISDEAINADYAIKEVTDMFLAIFETIDDPYIKERAADLKDVSKRVIRNLFGIADNNPNDIKDEVIIVAEDLTPSDTAQLDRQFVKGFITDIGGRTSHSAIMARIIEIPAVVGTKEACDTIGDNDVVIMDGFLGEVFVNPDETLIKTYEEKQEQYTRQKHIWAEMKDKATMTLDGTHVDLAANIGDSNDIEGVLNNGSEGIGLFRTECLYMGRDHLPTEDEQFEAYKVVLEKMDGKPVVVRTLDIGGDKELPYMDMPRELNPFLGYRAIRLCLDRKEMFRTQLRALLRASVYGNLKTMFPMIATINEFLDAKAFLYQIKHELIDEGINVSDDIELGIMVEIPSTVMLADLFAKEVDFFSIGTNDLIQYTFAADRMNEKVSYLYQPFNPSLLRMIKNVIDAAHKENKWVGMCGEMAGEILAVPILLGLGLDEFSMCATSILEARYSLSHIKKTDAEKLALEVINMRNQEEVITAVQSFLNSRNI